jgi:hypothetical protein
MCVCAFVFVCILSVNAHVNVHALSVRVCIGRMHAFYSMCECPECMQ